MLGTPWKGYYLTAYGIAVKHGFVGTEEEWLASLKGEPGAKAQVRYNESTDTLEWKTEEDEAWVTLMSLSDLQTELEQATIAEAQMAAADAKEAAGEAANAAQSALNTEKSVLMAEKAIFNRIEEYGTVVNNAYVLGDTLYIATSDGKVFTAGNVRGPKGDTGDSGVHIGTEEPTDPEKNVWIDTKEMAELSDVQKALDMLEYTDEGVTVDLGDYAKKAYVDAGDTSLKEYSDAPIETYIIRGNESEYFTDIVDNWHNEGFESTQGNAYVYNDISSYEPNIEVTLVKDLEITVRCETEFYASADGENCFSIVKNGEVIFAETKIDIAPGTVSYTDFKLTAKAGDVVKFDLNITNWACCWLYLFEEKDYKEYKPRDFAKRNEMPIYIEITNETPWEELYGCTYFVLYIGDKHYTSHEVVRTDNTMRINAFDGEEINDGKLIHITQEFYLNDDLKQTNAGATKRTFDLYSGAEEIEGINFTKIIGVKLPL